MLRLRALPLAYALPRSRLVCILKYTLWNSVHDLR